MTKNPFLNAAAAAGYIAIIVSFLTYVPKHFVDVEDTMLAPMIMISLVTLSAALMGYLFMYEPVALLIEGKKQEAVSLFLKTVFTFAGIIAILVAILLFLR